MLEQGQSNGRKTIADILLPETPQSVAAAYGRLAERAKVEAKCANLPEDKAAKVMAAFEAKVRAAQGDASAKGGE